MKTNFRKMNESQFKTNDTHSSLIDFLSQVIIQNKLKTYLIKKIRL
jgi:hypothetical protein